MRLLIGADIVPTDSNADLFDENGVEKLVGSELLEQLKAADYRIFNLEAPLIDVGTTIQKYGSAIKAPQKSVKGIKALGTNLLCLSNNHIMDYGEDGLTRTIQLLRENKIDYVGASLKNSWNSGVFVLQQDNIRIGLYNCCEHEFSVSKNNTAGANPFEPHRSIAEIEKLRGVVDYVIVLYHGGKEYYRYPSPELQSRCRLMVESGASVVITQHSHCIGAREKYQNGTIIYGQGNFIFDAGNDEFWKSSVLIEVNLDSEGFGIRYIPIEKNGNCIRLANDENAKKILNDFDLRSSEILDDEFVPNRYRSYASEKLPEYLIAMRGYRQNLFLRILNKLSGDRLFSLLSKNISQKERLRIINYLECEAHRELFLEGLWEMKK